MSSARKRVIVDLDVGNDDAFALLVLLYAEKLGNIKIEAIVCSMGNASLQNVCKNVVRLLEILHRTDIPVYKGVTDAIIPSESPIAQFHGQDGLGDLEHETEPDLSIIQKEYAFVGVRNIVVNNPKEIILVCLGPLTNLALPMKLYDNFAANIKEIFIMGGNYAGTGKSLNILINTSLQTDFHTAIGNVTETAEYNFYVDPEAAYIVLNNAKCLITIATWETCLNIHITLEWRWDVLGSHNTPFIDLLNRSERTVYSGKSPDHLWYHCDVLAILAMLYPKESIVRQSKHNATVELHGSKTRGQIVLDHLKLKEPNVVIVEKMDEEFVKNILLKAVESFPA